MNKNKKTLFEKTEEEFLRTTDTLWENEVQANIFVARILIYSAGVALAFLLLNRLQLLSVDQDTTFSIMLQSAIECLAAALICFCFKGKKKWLKLMLMAITVFIFGRTETVLGYNVYLLIVFPVALSIRYYSQPLTIATTILTLVVSIVADLFNVVKGIGFIDMNYAFLKPGSLLEVAGSIKDAVIASGAYDASLTLPNFLLRGYSPRIITFLLIAMICGKIARKGREAIYDQQAETQKSERISTELNLASSIQANMLPNIFPAFPEKKEFDIYASMTPAKEVGGDFYDFFMTDDEHLAIVIADVSGKGIPAAMFMVIAKTLIKDHTQLGLTPSMIFTRVNNLLCEGNEVGLFVTAWMAIIDIKTGFMDYANAGHNPPVFIRNGKPAYLNCKPGFVLAGLEDYEFEEYHMQLKTGDRIFLYTDGITEAVNSRKELYGEKRLIECLKSMEDKATCADTLHAIRQDIDNFVKDEEQFDDMTMLEFDFTPKSERGREVLERAFDANVENLHDVLAFVESGLEAHGADMKSTMAVTVSLEEIFVNIANYAYPDHQGKATVGMNFRDDQIEIYLFDNGIPFNPLEKEDPDVKAKLEERGIGGLGIYMAKNSMDECRYERKGNQNRFYMKRRIRG